VFDVKSIASSGIEIVSGIVVDVQMLLITPFFAPFSYRNRQNRSYAMPEKCAKPHNLGITISVFFCKSAGCIKLLILLCFIVVVVVALHTALLWGV